MRVTDKCDVFSFGVVALEVMMGRHPGELITSLSGELFLKDVLDQRLPPPKGQLAKAVAFMINVALACTSTTPDTRPSMRFVAQELSAKTQAYLPEPLDTMRISKLRSLQK